ncbi:uncharacterized protein LOC135412460 [Pseudopipra pipra]|uniref:uncharacterized protein LOC135412460 n=1 Tax=Pseudopipra pipra TaxID=415032 RepID=UPI003138DCEA
MEGWMKGCREGCSVQGVMARWMQGCRGGWMEGWRDGWRDGWREGRTGVLAARRAWAPPPRSICRGSWVWNCRERKNIRGGKEKVLGKPRLRRRRPRGERGRDGLRPLRAPPARFSSSPSFSLLSFLSFPLLSIPFQFFFPFPPFLFLSSLLIPPPTFPISFLHSSFLSPFSFLFLPPLVFLYFPFFPYNFFPIFLISFPCFSFLPPFHFLFLPSFLSIPPFPPFFPFPLFPFFFFFSYSYPPFFSPVSSLSHFPPLFPPSFFPSLLSPPFFPSYQFLPLFPFSLLFPPTPTPSSHPTPLPLHLLRFPQATEPFSTGNVGKAGSSCEAVGRVPPAAPTCQGLGGESLSLHRFLHPHPGCRELPTCPCKAGQGAHPAWGRSSFPRGLLPPALNRMILYPCWKTAAKRPSRQEWERGGFLSRPGSEGSDTEGFQRPWNALPVPAGLPPGASAPA